MATPQLTVAIATYRDFDGLYFTLQGLRANHKDVKFDIVVLDNAPERCIRSEQVTHAVGGRYYHRPDMDGTSRSRDLAIRLARTPWVLCCDSHVLFENGALESLVNYVETAEPSTMISGPLINDNGTLGGTHWTRQRPGTQLWGTWDVDQRAKDWEADIAAQGHTTQSAFEIEMNGLGVFVVNAKFWPGFNPLNRGFGGEEGIIHETYRRMGGKTVCLPALRWRHRFRDVGGWEMNPVPYPLRGEDHVWNLLVGMMECGLEAEAAAEEIVKDFSGHTHPARFRELVSEAKRLQPVGSRPPKRKRLNLVGMWYTDCSAPPPLMGRSLDSIKVAAEMHRAFGGKVEIGISSWVELEKLQLRNLPGVNRVFSGEKKRSHATILAQIGQAVQAATHGDGSTVDVYCFLEHDVIYPEDYFTRVEEAFFVSPSSPVFSNLDYIGLNETGYQMVKDRHEPMHQLSMAREMFWANLERAANECRQNGWALIEPQGDRSNWIRYQPRGAPQSAMPQGVPGISAALGWMPAIHVNHKAGRFTSHGEVCYGDAITKRHPHWGDFTKFWPHPLGQNPGCGSCPQPSVIPVQYATLNEWFDVAKVGPSDFFEHVETLRELAASCESAAELVMWGKPSLVALLAGCKGQVLSFAPDQPAPLMQWALGEKFAKDRFGHHHGPEAAEALKLFSGDLLFVDTKHTAATVYKQLSENAPRIKKYLVIHCTEIYGHTGDDGSPGVLHGIRRFLNENRHWVAIRREEKNHGLIVLSQCEEDRQKPPGFLRKALNYGKARVRHAANGNLLVSDAVYEERTSECLMCPHRALDVCAVCGCPIEAKASWASEQCPLKEPKWLKVIPTQT